MYKILNWIYENINFGDKEFFVALQNEYNEYEFMILIKNNISSLYIDIRKLLFSFISIILFIIFYKYEIQLISLEWISWIKIYLKIYIVYYILKAIYWLIKGLYELKILKNKDTEYIGQSVLFFVQLINFIINSCMFYYLIDINVELFLQYNILIILNLIMGVIFWYYENIMDYIIIKNSIGSFLNYPWIFIIIAIILIKNNKKIGKSLSWFLIGSVKISTFSEKK